MSNQNIITKFTFLLALPLMIIGSSCKKYLYEKPINGTYSEKFWVDAASVEQASNAMYSQLRDALRNGKSHFIFGDFTTGTFNTTEWNLVIKSPQFNFSYVPYREEALQNWSRFYRVIAQANIILKNVPQMSTAAFGSAQQKNKYIADALFVRAFTYFYITRVWGDPVYVTKVYDDVDYGNIPPIARTNESIVLDSCLRDLRIAAAFQQYGGGTPSMSIKANKGSTHALMAHIFAWKHQYDSTHVYCDKVINSGGYSLEPINTYKNIWAGMKSNESIFELPMQQLNETSYSFFGTFLKGPLVDNQSSTCWIAPENSLMDWMFDKTNDVRFSKVFSQESASNGDPKGLMLTKYSNFLYLNSDVKAGPYINNNLVIFRLADLYLLNAEALASTNDLAGAKQNLRMTEDRAGIDYYNAPTNSYEMLDEIVMERGRELIGEGQWFYDMIRTNQAQGWLEYVGYAATRITAENKGYYWPLDMATLFPQNNLLTQNPWWAKNK